MKKQHIILSVVVVLLLGAAIYWFTRPGETTPDYEGFEGWERFGLNESYNVGDFIPVGQTSLKSPVVTSSYLKNKISAGSSLLKIDSKSTFDSKRIDYSSNFSKSIDFNLVSRDLKNSISGMSQVNFDVYGGKQKRLAGGTVVLSEVIRNLPDETIEDMKLAIDRHDSIIFITEVMEYDSSKFSIIWNKNIEPEVQINIENDLSSLGSSGKWSKDRTYEIGSNIPKNFLFKYEPLTTSFKELIFRKNNKIVQKRVEETSKIALLNQPVVLSNWNSGRISGNSWRFERVNATLNPNGLLNISGKQSSNRWQGFTGALNIILKDKKGNILQTLKTKDSGVSGLSARPFNQTIKVEAEIAKKVAKIELEAVRM